MSSHLKPITGIELWRCVEAHAKWRRGEEGGERLVLLKYNLSGIDLSELDMRGCSLRYCDLSRCDMRECDMRGCNLGESNLRDCDMLECLLHGSDLRGCDLRDCDMQGARGIVMLPACDSRGYAFPHAVLCGDEWRVRAGCRDFTITEARKHWGRSYKGNREQGDIYLHAIDWLEGWIERHWHEHMER